MMGLLRAAVVMPLGCLHSVRASMAAREPPASSPQMPRVLFGGCTGEVL